MMRRASISRAPPRPARRASVDGARVERAADDDAGRRRRRPARRPRARGRATPTPPEAITGMPAARATARVPSRSGPSLRAVATDVGVDDRGRAPRRARVVAPAPARRRDRPRASPATAHHAVARVDADRDAARECAGRAPRTSAGSRTATVPRTTRAAPAVEHRLDRRRVAQPAAHLHGDADRGADRRHQRRLHAARRRARRRDRRRAASARPSASQRRAIATGSSP